MSSVTGKNSDIIKLVQNLESKKILHIDDPSKKGYCYCGVNWSKSHNLAKLEKHDENLKATCSRCIERYRAREEIRKGMSELRRQFCD